MPDPTGPGTFPAARLVADTNLQTATRPQDPDILGTLAVVTALWSIDAEPPVTPLAAGASPDAIHAALDPEDRFRFRAALDTASEVMRRDLDLAPVFAVLEEFRRLAILQTNRGAYQRVVRAAAAIATGQDSPDDEPFEVTRNKAGL